MRPHPAAAVSALVLLLLAVGVTHTTATESFTANAVPGHNPARVAVNGQAADPPVQVSIRVEAWSTPADIRTLRSVLLTENEDAVRDFLDGRAVGHVVSPVARSWKILLATQASTPKGRRVRLVTDHPLFLFASRVSHSAGVTQLDFSPPGMRTGLIEFSLEEGAEGQGVVRSSAWLTLHEDGHVAVRGSANQANDHPLLRVRSWGEHKER